MLIAISHGFKQRRKVLLRTVSALSLPVLVLASLAVALSEYLKKKKSKRKWYKRW
jgi:hypothetical protein